MQKVYASWSSAAVAVRRATGLVTAVCSAGGVGRWGSGVAANRGNAAGDEKGKQGRVGGWLDDQGWVGKFVGCSVSNRRGVWCLPVVAARGAGDRYG